MRRKKSRKKFDISFENAAPRYLIDAQKFDKLVSEILKCLSISSASVSFCFLSDQKMVAQNRKYFRKNRTTDVIAFPWTVSKKVGKREGYLGDICISLDRARFQHRAFGNSFVKEFVTYVTHGILHLLGYQDKKRKDKELMFRRQDQVLKKIFCKKSLLLKLIQVRKLK